MENDNSILVQYLRDPVTDLPFGCIAATSPKNIGVSLCNPKDQWNKKLARTIAIGRARKGNFSPETLPCHEHGDLAFDMYINMKSRAKSYFRNPVQK